MIPAPPFALHAYAGLSRLAAPFASVLLRSRVKAGKEDAARLPERLGHAGLPRPDGRLIWLHAASVGETMSVLPLIGELVAHGRLLLTTGTLTSAELAAKRLPEGAVHQFAPLDLAGATVRFLNHWRPDLALFTESELWPNLMTGCYARGIPLGIVNGRMSDRSFQKWRKLPKIAGAILRPLAFCLAQSDIDSKRYAELGAPAISPGNLKFDVPALPFSSDERDALREAIGPRPVLVAASTHPGEEEQVLEAAARLRDDAPDLLTILVPRHPIRGQEVATMCQNGGIHAKRRGLGEMPGSYEPVYIADTLGELGLFYAVADVAFIGGSLVPHGGHNPIEAVKLGVPVLTGPHFGNFTFVFNELQAAHGVIEVPDVKALAAAVASLLGDRAVRDALSERAASAFARHEGALARTMETLLPVLAETARR